MRLDASSTFKLHIASLFLSLLHTHGMRSSFHDIEDLVRADASEDLVIVPVAAFHTSIAPAKVPVAANRARSNLKPTLHLHPRQSTRPHQQPFLSAAPQRGQAAMLSAPLHPIEGMGSDPIIQLGTHPAGMHSVSDLPEHPSQEEMDGMVMQHLDDAKQSKEDAMQLSTLQGATKIQSSIKDAMFSVNAALRGWVAVDGSWFTTLSSQPFQKLSNVLTSFVTAELINVVLQMSFHEKLSLMFKIVRQTFTWVVAQKNMQHRRAAIQLLVRYFLSCKGDEACLFAGSTEDASLLHKLDDQLKGRAASLLLSMAPSLREIAMEDLRQSASEKLGWFAERLPPFQAELKEAQSWLDKKGIETNEDRRIDKAQPDIFMTVKVSEAAHLVNGVRNALQQVEKMTLQRSRGDDNSHEVADMPAGSLMNILASSMSSMSSIL